jgi:hypothetical protein
MTSKTRIVQFERDIARAVDKLVAEFYHETEMSPHAVDIELERETRADGDSTGYVVTGARAHFER